MAAAQAEAAELRRQLAAVGAQWEEFAAAERAALEQQLQAGQVCETDAPCCHSGSDKGLS